MKCDKLGNCVGITRNNKVCHKKCIGKYCQFHEYFNDYTDEMMENLILCTGCKMQKYLPNGGVCNICLERGKKNREQFRENVTLCKYIDKLDKHCTFKVEPKLNNGYCGKHQTYFWKEDKEKDGVHKVCLNFIRGCRNLLGLNEDFSRCLSCREKDRPKDKVRNIVRKEKRENNNQVILNKLIEERKWGDIMFCSCCKAESTLMHFLEDENNIESKLFETCRKCRKKDLIREAMEERKEYKQKLENTTKLKLSRYKKGARIRDLDFELEKEEFDKLVIDKCFYCGEKDNVKLNGVDRINSEIGYNKDNCVPCCSMCNYLKNNLSQDEFFNKIKHIMSNFGYGTYKNDDLFKDRKSMSFSRYIICAKDRSIKFNLNENQFYKIISMNCYLCNKSNTNLHRNGIDRFDSTKDYDLNNILPCCGDCNLMKNDFIFENMLMKFMKISKIHFDNDIKILNQNSSLKKINDAINSKKKFIFTTLNKITN